MIIIQNDENFNFKKDLIEKIAKNFSHKDIELIITNDENMKKLNFKSRGINSTTDVLSFPLEEIAHTPLGSIVINKDSVIKVSNKLKHTPEEEIALLFVHGLLHLLGYDHENDNGEMRKKEEEIIKEYHLPKSLIVRIEK